VPRVLAARLFLQRTRARTAPSDGLGWWAQPDQEEEQMQGRILGKLTYVGIGRSRVVRNKRRETRRYDREIQTGLAEYQEERAGTSAT
jgi:hypothetical protein